MNFKSTLAVLACLAATTACSKSEPEAATNVSTPDASATATQPAAAPSPSADAEGIVGSWVDDESDTYSFAGDGTASSQGQVAMTGTWKQDGASRYDVDLNSPAGLAKGVACVQGDTMAMRIGDGSVTLLGRVGADGKPAEPEKSFTCD